MAVTPESNLALIEELQELVGASTYEPVDGPEFSYPAVGQAVDDEMWKFITLAMGNGVLDMGDGSYWLKSFNNANNTVVIEPGRSGLAHAVVGGFYHRLQKSMTLSVPMPTSETTYYVVLELNPLRARDPEGPISVKVYPNEVNTESGRQHLVLWTITRRPNQLLTEASVQRFRPRVSPVMYVWSEDQKPDVNSVLWGSMLIVGKTNNIYRSESRVGDDDRTEGAQWKLLNDYDPEFSNPGDTDAYVNAGHGYPRGARLTRDGYIELRGHLARSDGSNFTVGSHGYQMYNLKNWPKGSNQQFVTVSTGYDPAALVKLEYSPTTQTVRAYPINRDCSWINLDGVRIYVGRNQ